MPDKNEKITFATVAEEHLREAERLKKAWFDHVLLSLERLSANVNRLSSDLYDVKDSLFKDIVSTKESLRTELLFTKSEMGVELEKLEKRIEKNIDNINKTINSISTQAVKDELKKNLDDLKLQLNADIEAIKKEHMPIRDSILILKVKVAMWGVLGGIIGTALLSALFNWLFPLIK